MIQIKNTYTLIVTSLFLFICLISNSLAQQSVTWTDTLGVSISGSTVTKTAPSAEGNSGAISVDFLPVNANGWVQSTVLEMGTSRTFGFSETNDNANYTTIDFAIHTSYWLNQLIVFENGTSKYSVSNGFAVGDILKVERINNQILYKKNDSIFYTSTLTSISELKADISLFTQNSTLGNLTVSNSLIDPNEATSYVPTPHEITWTDTLGLEFLDQHIRKTASSVEGNSGAVSIDFLPIGANGWIQSTILEMGTARTFGLSETNDDANYATIDFGIHTSYWYNQLIVFENGASKYSINNGFAIGDIFKVERLNNQILYKKNDSIFYTSTLTSISELKADISLYTQNSTLGNVKISDSFIDPDEADNTGTAPHSITWTDTLGIEFLGEHIRKTAVTDTGNSGAFSVDFLPATVGGYIESTILEFGTARTFGLSEVNDGANRESIDFAIHTSYWQGTLAVHENGDVKFSTANGYQVGDVFKVERTGNQIRYLKNDSIFYTSNLTSITELHADISLYSHQATLGSLKLSDSFSNPATTFSGTSLWSQNNNVVFYNETVAIGTDTPLTDHLLSVNGKIAAKGVKVTLNGWADFVFKNNYDLMSIKELQKFIEQNGHLPDIPKTNEVLSQGIYLGEMNKLLLQKIEELTLHLIKQNDRIEKLESEIKKKK